MKQLLGLFIIVLVGLNLQASISPDTEMSNLDKYREVTRCQKQGLDMLSVVDCYDKLLSDDSALELSLAEKRSTDQSFKKHLTTCQSQCKGWTCYKIEYKYCAVTKVLRELGPKYQTSRPSQPSKLIDEQG